MFMVMSTTSANCERIKKIFATLSMRIYVAEISIIDLSVAIKYKRGFVKQVITIDKIR